MDADAPLPPPAQVPDPGPRRPRSSAPNPLRTVAWRGRDDITLVAAPPGGTVPTRDDVVAVARRAALQGSRRLVTGALTDPEQRPYLAAGFVVHDRLHLLRHDMVDVPPPPTIRAHLRRARGTDVARALAVDARAFEPFWRLDRSGLDDALDATAAARFRVAVDDGTVVGYAVTGRSGGRGYLQRLAVDPERRREGLGAGLVADGLRWLHRRRVRSAVVNTQVGNDAAFALYRRLGFVPEPTGLTVLTLPLDGWA